MKTRKASAIWNGTLKEGRGTMSLGSGAIQGQYSYMSRFEEGPGTNPEELIGAALAGCFSMALSADLGRAGHNPDQIQTQADVSFGPVDGKATIQKIHLTTQAVVPGIDEQTFQQVAEGAKKGCPVSRALNTEITLDAQLVDSIS